MKTKSVVNPQYIVTQLETRQYTLDMHNQKMDAKEFERLENEILNAPKHIQDYCKRKLREMRLKSL